MSRSKAPLTAAIRHLRRRIEAPAEGRTALPPIKELARQAGVSAATMIRAVHQVAHDGLITVRKGVGIQRVATNDAGPRVLPLPEAALSRAQETARRIQADIATGVLNRQEPLPSRKMLQARYGVCYRTLRDSLRILCGERLLLPERKSYRIRTFSPAQHGGFVLLVGWGQDSTRLTTVTVRTEEHMRLLERECTAQKIGLLPLPLYYRGTVMSGGLARIRELAAGAGRDRGLLGCIVWTVGIPVDSVRALLGVLAMSRTPVAVLDEEGMSEELRERFSGERIRYFSMAASDLPGVIVGRYLLEQGHRHIAYIGHRGLDRRRAGLESVYVVSGMPEAVRSYVLDTPTSPPRPSAGLGRKVSSLMASQGLSPDSLAYPGRTVATEVRELLEQELSRRRMYQAVEQCLRTALAEWPATAVVGYNDAIALACSDYLLKEHIKGIRVVGFDDSRNAFLRGFSSYNFNAVAYTKAMVSFILDHAGGYGHPAGGGSEITELEGFVVQRGG